MGYTLEVTDGSGTFVFPVTTIFPERVDNVFDDNNELQSRSEVLRVSGFDKGATPSPTFDKITAFRALALRNGPQTVVIKLDGNPVRTLTPAGSFKGPHITNWTEEASPAGKANHTKFSFLISVDLVGRTCSGVPVKTIDRTVEVKTEGDNVVQKVWRILVKAKTIAEAEVLANAFSPTVEGLDNLKIKQIDRNTFQAVFTWDRRRSEDQRLNMIREVITVSQGGKPIRPVRVTGNLPVLRRGQIRAWEITFDLRVTGQFASFEEASTVLGAFQGQLHYTEENLDPTRSDQFSDPTLEDEKGTYTIRIREHYVFDDEPARPDHVTHNAPTEPGEEASDVPPDGAGFAQDGEC